MKRPFPTPPEMRATITRALAATRRRDATPEEQLAPSKKVSVRRDEQTVDPQLRPTGDHAPSDEEGR